LCDCGNFAIVDVSNLKSGNTKSCGCFYKETRKKLTDLVILPKGEACSKRLYHRYKRSARLRNIEWDLSFDYSMKLFKDNCFYCGVEPYRVHIEKRLNGDFIYNGIDRVDNFLGYHKENCVSCCAFCNRAKCDMEFSGFRDWIKSAYNHLFNQGN
jgi:hypothetical protein